ncbi:unnamed protein product [Toxocara canis]|uniref:Transmembrane protein n=1 Tax=Toxocara canis TaxID=6265 RepID=A0A183UZX3_TOXCA|nr:unnamed protein product [Toxocara canis]
MHSTAGPMVLGSIFSIQRQLMNVSLPIESTTVPHVTLLRPFERPKDSVIPIVEFVLGTITYIYGMLAFRTLLLVMAGVHMEITCPSRVLHLYTLIVRLKKRRLWRR